jgi:repressor LexA
LALVGRTDVRQQIRAPKSTYSQEHVVTGTYSLVLTGTGVFTGDVQLMPPALTRQQRKILEAVHFFLSRREIPTVREVGALVGLRSPATVLKHLRALEKESWISLSGKSRGIRLLRPIPHDSSSSSAEGESSADGGFSPERGPFPDTGASLAKGSTLRPSEEAVGSAQRRRGIRGGIRISGAIAAGRPFESYSEGFTP